ncbi:MAG TPA: tetratricopeptide repeat protein [Verrucomicrobiae bacterium]|nr:tetratricopeptide repeat protein [Verrucomicrobiae bacterium]
MKAQKLFPLVVVAAGLLAYQNSFTGSYFLDDFHSIPENPTIRHLWPIWLPLSPPHQNWLTVEGRPLINLSLAINYALGGFNVWGYHALNLTVHILAGLALLGIVRRTLLQPPLRGRFGAAADELALATAVLWTVHPLQTESVTYIIQRAESIMGLFYLLTLYCFIRGVELASKGNGKWLRGNGSRGLGARLWYTLSVTACVLGMASKEVMVTAPVMVLLYDRAFVSDSFRDAWRRRWPVYLALVATWGVLIFVEVRGGIFAYGSATAHRIGRWNYFLTQPGAILYYLRLSVWPSPLALDHRWPIATTWMRILPPMVVVGTLLGASAWAWARRPAWGFAGAWFFLILAPSSSFMTLPDPLCDHRMYLPLAIVASLAVTGLYVAAGRRSLVGLAVVAIGLGFLTWRHNQGYCRNPHFSLGLAYQRAGMPQEAIEQFEQALRDKSDDALTHFNLGVALMTSGRQQEAMEHFDEALKFRPNFTEAHYLLANILAQKGKLQEAIEQYEQTLTFMPDFAEAHFNLGIVLQEAGMLPEAMEEYQQALRFNPDLADAHNNLGIALFRSGKLQEAIQHYEQALKLKPDNAGTHNNLAVALQQTGRLPEAIAQYEEALRIQPNYPMAHYNLATVLEQVGHAQEAVQHYDQALRLKPDYAAARDRLAKLRAAQ